MQLIIRHLFRDIRNFYVTHFFDTLYHKLIDKFPQHSFEIVNDKSYEHHGYGGIYSCMNFSIINPESGRYIVISFFDNWKYHFMRHLGWNPSNMVQFFYPGGFNYIDYFCFKNDEKHNSDIVCPSNIKDIYQSFFYSPHEKGSLDIIEDLYHTRKNNDTKPIMHFRGYMWDFRKRMTDNINDNTIIIIDKNTNQNHLEYNNYLKDLSQYRCALSLPGGTEVCNRDIECFGIGIPVIRPFLNIEYPDPLIPNYHYISCYHDCKYWHGNPEYLSYSDFINHLKYYWHKVKDNFEYLDFVSNNAREWFVKNCTLENNINYVISQLNMEKL